ncbi:MAG: TldD/PmbA family protein [Promethearchaeota archaeon]
MNKTDLINLGEKAINQMKKDGIDQSELYINKSREVSIEIERGSIKYSKEITDFGCSIRAIKDGCLGFSYTTSINPKSISKLIKRVEKLAKIGLSDPDFKNLPTPKKLPQIQGIYDSNIANLDVSEAVRLILDLLEHAYIDKRIYSINCSLTCSYEQTFIMNSLGVEAIEDDKNGHTSITIFAEITAKQGQEMSSGFEFQNGRFIKEINIEEIGKNAAKLAIDSLGAKRIETCEVPIVFHPIALHNIFSTAIGNAINAESIQYGRSYLLDKLNKEIAVKEFEVTDDGIYIKNGIAGLGTSAFDGEGTPQQKTRVIKDGILINYLHNSYTAGKANIQSTGNASRGNFRRIPTISPTNLIIKPGSGNKDDLISEVDKGILVIWTGDRPNLATGEFSGLIGAGFKIENGEIAFPLKQTMIGINMLDFFQRIDKIGKDIRQISNIITPTIRINKGKIGGK